MKLLVTREQTQGRFALVEITITRGRELPLHAHTREDELLYVVAGDLDVYLNDAWHHCPQGNAVFLPRGSEHALHLRSSEARLLALAMPPGLEDYYRELEAPMDDGHYIEWLIGLSARYGVEIPGCHLPDPPAPVPALAGVEGGAGPAPLP